MEQVPAPLNSGDTNLYGPAIDKPLLDGHRMHGFRSGGGLRVIRIENNAGELVGYGEAPQVEAALGHAALDYALGHESYDQQYGSEHARHTGYLTGTTEASSPLDAHLLQGSTFNAYKAAQKEEILVSLVGTKFPPEVPAGLTEHVIATGQPETFVERGITYQAEPSQFPNGDRGVSIKEIANPDNIPSTSYTYQKIGVGQTFAKALAQAFRAAEVELM